MKKLLLYSTAFFFLSCTSLRKVQLLHADHPQTFKGLLFQIGDQTGQLLIRGDPFDKSAKTFWKIWGHPCTMYCEQEGVLVIGMIRHPKKQSYGTGLFFRKNNLWDLQVFVGEEDYRSHGGIATLCLCDGDKYKATFFDGSIASYPKWGSKK